MEIKEALDILKGICPNGFALVPLISNEKEALLTAISHLETLQKVKEAGGVKQRIAPERSEDTGNSDDDYDNGVEAGEAWGFNEAVDLKDAGLAGKLERLEEFLATVDVEFDFEVKQTMTGKELQSKLKKKICKALSAQIQAFILGNVGIDDHQENL